MIYKVEKTFSYCMTTYIEADSKEEAMEMTENSPNDFDWEEDCEHCLEDVSCMVGLDADGKPVNDLDEVEDWD